MSPTSYQLLYPAMLDYKDTDFFRKCNPFCEKSPLRILHVTGTYREDFSQTYDIQEFTNKSRVYVFMNAFIPEMSVLEKDFWSPVVRFLSWTVPALASSPPLMERNGMDFRSA